MIRADVLKKTGIRYQEKFETIEDFVLWNELGKVTKLHNLREIHLLYRLHKTNTSLIRNKEQKNKTDEYIKQIIADFGDFSKEKEDDFSKINVIFDFFKVKNKIFSLSEKRIIHNFIETILRNDLLDREVFLKRIGKKRSAIYKHIILSSILEKTIFRFFRN